MFCFVLQALFEAGEETDGIDIAVFIEILTRRNGFQLAKSKRSLKVVMPIVVFKYGHVSGEECIGVAGW